MRATFLDVSYPLESNLLDPPIRSAMGDSALSTGRKLEKPRRQFVITIAGEYLLSGQMELLRNAIHSARITGVMWYDGGSWNEITEPIWIADGNSVQTEFLMPFDNVYAPSWILYENGVINTGWTMKEQSGVVVFNTAPTGRITGKGKRKFRVVMEDQSDVILKETQHHQQVFSMGTITLREVQAVNIF